MNMLPDATAMFASSLVNTGAPWASSKCEGLSEGLGQAITPERRREKVRRQAAVRVDFMALSDVSASTGSIGRRRAPSAHSEGDSFPAAGGAEGVEDGAVDVLGDERDRAVAAGEECATGVAAAEEER